MPRLAPQSTALSCPRCGYDQRGTLSAWRETCPLDGVCTECGLDFEWRELLNPRHGLPRWSVEFGVRWIHPRQVLATFLWTFRPDRFWSAIRMSHPSRLGRVAAYLAILVVVLYIPFAVAVGFEAWREYTMFTRSLVPSSDVSSVVTQAMLLPYSDTSIGFYTEPQSGRTWGYGTPRGHTIWIVARLWAAAVLTLGAHICCCVAFAALPVSRRRAKVRTVHVIRVGLYGFALLVPVTVLGLFGAGSANPMLAQLTLFVWGLLLPMEIAWWWLATRRYLRMPHALGVGVSAVAIGVLLPLAVMSLFWFA